MLNAAHLLETALLLLVAYLVGCMVGHIARRRVALARRRRAAAAASVEFIDPLPAPQAAAAPLVVAPVVSPLPVAGRRSAAQRLAASARDDDPPEIVTAVPTPKPPREPLPQAEIPLPAATAHGRRPASRPGEAEAGVPHRHLRDEADWASDGDAVVGAPSEPDSFAVHPDDIAHVAAGPPLRHTEVLTALAQSAFAPRDQTPDPPAEDAEAEARRAIEGDWTPRRRRSGHAELPEGVRVALPGEAESAMDGARSAVAAATAAAAEALRVVAPEPAPAAARPAVTLPDAQTGRPPSLTGPRGGIADDLTLVRGISPIVAEALNGAGIWHLDQIAAWSTTDVDWVEAHLAIRGRVGTERWIEQAQAFVTDYQAREVS